MRSRWAGLADRVGRRRPVIAATLLFAIGTALTSFAPTLEMMTAIRFVTGIGLGGVLPNLVSLVTEFAPRRLRGTLTTVTFSSLPFGAMLASLFAHASMESYGWQSLFYVGAILPILVAGVAACSLPESVHFLTLAGDRQPEIARILRRVAPDLAVERTTTFDAGERRNTPVSFPALVGPGRTRTTVLLVAVVALNMSMLYFTLNWLPLLMNGAGLSREHALLATVIVNAAGGLGAMAWGLLMDRFGRIHVMAAAGVAAFAGLALLGVGHDLTRAADGCARHRRRLHHGRVAGPLCGHRVGLSDGHPVDGRGRRAGRRQDRIGAGPDGRGHPARPQLARFRHSDCRRVAGTLLGLGPVADGPRRAGRHTSRGLRPALTGQNPDYS